MQFFSCGKYRESWQNERTALTCECLRSCRAYAWSLVVHTVRGVHCAAPPLKEDPANAPLLCLKAVPDEQEPLPEMPFALALPAIGESFLDVSRWMQAKQCALVTTDGEIPYRIEIQRLEQHVAAMRLLLES